MTMFNLVFTVLIVLHFMNVLKAAPTTISLPSKWQKQTLTYSILKFPTKLSKADTQATFRTAFAQFTPTLSKTFKEISTNDTSADFKITFESLEGLRLASAEPNGDIKINDNENWKYYTVGDIVDPQRRDITYQAMSTITAVLSMNNVIYSTFVSKDYVDSNGRYVLPKFGNYGG